MCCQCSPPQQFFLRLSIRLKTSSSRVNEKQGKKRWFDGWTSARLPPFCEDHQQPDRQAGPVIFFQLFKSLFQTSPEMSSFYLLVCLLPFPVTCSMHQRGRNQQPPPPQPRTMADHQKNIFSLIYSIYFTTCLKCTLVLEAFLCDIQLQFFFFLCNTSDRCLLRKQRATSKYLNYVGGGL